MDGIEVEHDHGRAATVVLSGVACAAGIAGWWLADCCWGLIAYFVAVWILVTMRLLVTSLLQPPLPADASRAVEKALEAFARRYPDDKVTSTAIRAVEPDRIIVSVRYGTGRPGPRRYFAVSRPRLDTVTELDIKAWWPRGLR